eukprot:1399656-Alexandrium_andersonii.AAC.1
MVHVALGWFSSFTVGVLPAAVAALALSSAVAVAAVAEAAEGAEAAEAEVAPPPPGVGHSSKTDLQPPLAVMFSMAVLQVASSLATPSTTA